MIGGKRDCKTGEIVRGEKRRRGKMVKGSRSTWEVKVRNSARKERVSNSNTVKELNSSKIHIICVYVIMITPLQTLLFMNALRHLTMVC